MMKMILHPFSSGDVLYILTLTDILSWQLYAYLLLFTVDVGFFSVHQWLLDSSECFATPTTEHQHRTTTKQTRSMKLKIGSFEKPRGPAAPDAVTSESRLTCTATWEQRHRVGFTVAIATHVAVKEAPTRTLCCARSALVLVRRSNR